MNVLDAIYSYDAFLERRTRSAIRDAVFTIFKSRKRNKTRITRAIMFRPRYESLVYWNCKQRETSLYRKNIQSRQFF